MPEGGTRLGRAGLCGVKRAAHLARAKPNGAERAGRTPKRAEAAPDPVEVVPDSVDAKRCNATRVTVRL